jgi:hypothetical protein
MSFNISSILNLSNKMKWSSSTDMNCCLVQTFLRDIYSICMSQTSTMNIRLSFCRHSVHNVYLQMFRPLEWNFIIPSDNQLNSGQILTFLQNEIIMHGNKKSCHKIFKNDNIFQGENSNTIKGLFKRLSIILYITFVFYALYSPISLTILLTTLTYHSMYTLNGLTCLGAIR